MTHVTGITLSPREREVAALVAAGMTNREIAARLSVAERTAEYHVEQIRNKLGFRSRLHIAAWFMEQETAGPHVPGNIPVSLSSFVGREREIANMQRLLAQNRLVSIAGPPGIGKTRFALQVASRMATRFRDGCWLIEVGPISEGAQVPAATAAALRVTERPGEDLIATVASAWRQRRALLVLDNCEHVLDAAASTVEALLRACPEIRILTTTRQQLRATGEVVYRIPPLVEAEKLFYERAVQSVPDFEMTPAVTAICRELEGLPLAIELAAARVSQMSADELAAGLTQGLRLLTSGSRTAARRQQSLKAAIEWSYDLLTPNERLVFARLSVFVGGFSLGAAEAVCGAGLREVGDLVLALTDKSIVSTTARRGRSTRYQLLETLRQYAAERLVETGELDRTQRLHFKLHLDLGESDSPRRPIHTEQVVQDRTEEEIANFRAALEWSRAHDPEGHLRLASSLSYFWRTRGSMVEGRAWLEAALAASGDHGQTRADVLWALGIIAVRQGDAESCRRYNREAMDIYRRLEDWGQLARVMNNLAQVTEDPAAARGLLAEGLECARRANDSGVVGLLLNSHGSRLRADGDPAAARAAFEESLALRRLSGHEWAISRSLLTLGNLALDDGDRTLARVYLSEALEIVSRSRDSWGLALVFEAFARRSADPSRVVRLAGSAHAQRDHSGDLNRSFESPALEERLHSTRLQLGSRADEIEAAGYAMSLDEAVTEALSEP